MKQVLSTHTPPSLRDVVNVWKKRESALESKSNVLTTQLLEKHLQIDLWKKQEETGVKEKETLESQIQSLHCVIEEKEKEIQSLSLTLDEEVVSKLTRRQNELQEQSHQIENELHKIQTQHSGKHRSKRRRFQPSSSMTRDQLEVGFEMII